jgi:penicillin-binding protein 1A
MGAEPLTSTSLLRTLLVWLRRLVLLTLALAGLGMIGIALVVRHFERDLPSVDELKRYSPPQVTRILARDGTLLGEDFVERRTVVAIGDIPPQVKLAFLAAEDASFFEHEGLDYAGMLRAMWVNLRSSSRQGASTITQQVVKNVLLTQERTYERKVKEVILARRIEQDLGKEEILELYLNHIYFGHGRYGVEEASRYYFGKGVGELSLGEAAILAGVPKGPTRYSPRENLPRALRRRSYVLDQMVTKGFAKPELADAAAKEQVVLAPEPEHDGELASEVVAEARRVLREAVGERASRGGYVVHTSIDPKLQAAARKSLRAGLEQVDQRKKHAAPLTKPKKMPELFEGNPLEKKQPSYLGEVTGADDAKNELFVRVGTMRGSVNLSHAERYNPKKLPASKFAEVGAPVRVSLVERGDANHEGVFTRARFRLELGPQGAVVAIDVRTRDVLALVGSYEGLRGGLDRATQSRRQPGSTFKTFVYSYAIHARRFTPASLVPTDPAIMEPGYRPKNYDGSVAGEPKRLREVLAKSVNVSAAWLITQVGPNEVAAWAEAAGIQSKLGATPSLALGAYEVGPRELANAYATFAAGGTWQPEQVVTRIVGPDGAEVPLPPRPAPRRAMSEAEAYVTTDLLKSVVEDGTGKAAKVLRRPIAGKTGTSNEARDAWFAGYSTDIASVVWVGHDDRLPLGAGESGGRTALPIFVELMRVAHQGTPATDFPAPAGIVRAPIDPATGLRARPDQEDAFPEVFLAGTEPTETAEEPKEPGEGEGGGDAGTPAEPGAVDGGDAVPVEEPPPAPPEKPVEASRPVEGAPPSPDEPPPF